VPAADSKAGGDDSRFGVGDAHSYRMFYQLARITPATEADFGGDPLLARYDDPFLIVIASASNASNLDARAAEFITFEGL
ncbi:MAG TPA: hypothetical protein VFY40_09695, partial [Blastocatellia bacterium]|nr:hypothetical protein [Blastocatellia bacterium]